MKRIDLIKILNEMDVFLSEMEQNMIFNHNPLKGITQPVPRHNEINEYLLKK